MVLFLQKWVKLFLKNSSVSFFVESKNYCENETFTLTLQGEEKVLDKVLQSGQCFGEVALITKAPRNATIIASEDVKCGGNKYADFVFSGTFHNEPN